MTRSTRPSLALLAAAFAVLALAACGGSDGGSSDTSTSASDEQETRLAFQDCLRDRGIDINVGDDGGIMVTGRQGDAPDLDRTQGAMEECRRTTGWAPRPPSEERQAEMRDRALEFAQCMREHGVDMDDPSPDGRMTMRIEGNRAGFDRASRACGQLGGPAIAQPAK